MIYIYINIVCDERLQKNKNKILVINFERCRPLVSFLASWCEPKAGFFSFLWKIRGAVTISAVIAVMKREFYICSGGLCQTCDRREHCKPVQSAKHG